MYDITKMGLVRDLIKGYHNLASLEKCLLSQNTLYRLSSTDYASSTMSDGRVIADQLCGGQ